MERRNLPELVLTQRDAKLFAEIAKYGLLSTSQIESRIFPGILDGTVLRRLRRLEAAGWLYRIRATEAGEYAWLLTRYGERSFQVDTPMIRPNRNGVEHDVGLVGLRHRLESIGLGENFVSEWSLRRQVFRTDKRGQPTVQLIPDGIFSATLWNKTTLAVAVELELHAKTTRRYESIFAKYREKGSLGLVWYFVRSESFGRALLAKWDGVKISFWKARQANVALAVTILSEFEADPMRARLLRSGDDEPTVEDFFRLRKTQEPAAQGVGRQIENHRESETIELAS